MNFLFYFHNNLYTGCIYLEMVGTCRSRPQSTVHIEQFNFFLWCHGFSVLLGSTSSITWYYSRLEVLHTTQWKIHEKHKRSLLAVVHSLLERWTAHVDLVSTVLCFKFKFKLTTIEFTAVATGGGYETITVVHIYYG